MKKNQQQQITYNNLGNTDTTFINSNIRKRILDNYWNLEYIYNNITPSKIIIPTANEDSLNTSKKILSSKNENVDGHLSIHRNQFLDNGRYRVLDLIRILSFARVYKCQSVSNENEFVTIKIINNQPQSNISGEKELEALLEISSGTPSEGKKYVQQISHHFFHNNHLCIVSPLLSHPLFDIIHQETSIAQILTCLAIILKQLLLGINYVHSLNWAHCDLKPDNILFTDETYSNIQIVNFGSTIHLPKETNSSYFQAFIYQSPEVLLGLPYTTLIDMWSIGCIAVELYTDIPLFACESETDCIHEMAAVLGPFPCDLLLNSSYWWKYFDATSNGFSMKLNPESVFRQNHLQNSYFDNLADLSLSSIILNYKQPVNEKEKNMLLCFTDFLQGLIQIDPKKRFTAEEALHHPFITGEPYEPSYHSDAKPNNQTVEVNKQAEVSSSNLSSFIMNENDFLMMF